MSILRIEDLSKEFGGILAVVRHEVILGVILILLAVLVGPGGVSLLS